MASRSGDMRRLLNVCAAAVDLLVQEASEPQQERQNGAPSHTSQHAQTSQSGHEISGVPECFMEFPLRIAYLPTHYIPAADQGGQAEPAPAMSLPRLVGIAPMFRAICQLQGGATPPWSPFFACLLRCLFLDFLSTI